MKKNLIKRARRWLSRTLFLLSPEPDRLIAAIKSNTAKHTPGENSTITLIENSKDLRSDKLMLRTMAQYSDRWQPVEIALVYSALDGRRQRDVISLTERHFAIYREMRELSLGKGEMIAPNVRHQDLEMRHGLDLTLRYALQNPNDWELLSQVLRTRDTCDYGEIMTALNLAKDNGSTAFSSGVL